MVISTGDCKVVVMVVVAVVEYCGVVVVVLVTILGRVALVIVVEVLRGCGIAIGGVVVMVVMVG